MDTPVIVAIISAAAAIVVSALSFSLTKSKERQADWQRYKFELYKELVQSLSGIVGTDSTPDGNRRFASAANTLHLIASKGVLDALHRFQDEIRVSNTRRNDDRHDELLARLEWEIREDLRIPNNPPLDQFKARLWCSGGGPAATVQYGGTMDRKALPRLYELIDQNPLSPDAYFTDFDNPAKESRVRLKHFQHIEEDLQGLDPDSWAHLKAELVPLLTVRDAKRGWPALFNKLNEARGYNHLVRIGCTNVKFIPRSSAQGRKTPDVEGDLGLIKVLCEVKTVNISDVEASRRSDGTVGTISDQLPEPFFNKLKSTLEQANRQMIAHCSVATTRRIAYIIVNYDDSLHEYAQDYSSQIGAFVAADPVAGLEMFLDAKPPYYSATA